MVGWVSNNCITDLILFPIDKQMAVLFSHVTSTSKRKLMKVCFSNITEMLELIGLNVMKWI